MWLPLVLPANGRRMRPAGLRLLPPTSPQALPINQQESLHHDDDDAEDDDDDAGPLSTIFQMIFFSSSFLQKRREERLRKGKKGKQNG